MKKILLSMAVMAGVAAFSPVMAQRANPIDKAQYKYERHHQEFKGERNKAAHPGKRGKAYHKKGKHHRHGKFAHQRRAAAKGKCHKPAPRGTYRRAQKH
ncbi:MAG: hypothetical protein R3A50_04545 [Saprospiraceae bacterium]|nr:hypothetical protein [Saprospiraceae bacterium]MCB9342611.1 hypothetical protein [Lewinellaceae bacterium]